MVKREVKITGKVRTWGNSYAVHVDKKLIDLGLIKFGELVEIVPIDEETRKVEDPGASAASGHVRNRNGLSGQDTPDPRLSLAWT